MEGPGYPSGPDTCPDGTTLAPTSSTQVSGSWTSVQKGGPVGPRGNINTHQGSGLPQHGFRGAFEVLGSREATWAESPNAYFLRYFFSC